MSAAAKALAVPAVLLVAAELAVRSSGTTSDAVAAPSAVVAALAVALADGTMLAATRDTLVGTFAGLLLGAAIGLLLGLAFGLVRPLDRLMEITIESIRPIPSVALIPIGMLSLGFGYRFELAIVAFACVWPMLIMTRSAIGGIEPRLIEARRLLDDTGTLYLHLDYREAHYAKVALDRLFGRECFLNEIIWAYDYGGKSTRRWP